MVRYLIIFCLLIYSCRISQKFIKIPKNSYLNAFGNEPGWNLKINPDKSITWVNNYGQDTIILDAGKEEYLYSKYKVKQVSTERMYFAEQDITIDLRHEKCNDDMTGKAFEKSIILIHEGKTYRGCANFEEYK